MAELPPSSPEQPKSQITYEVNPDTDELEIKIKYKDKSTWTHITLWNCEVVAATFDLPIRKELLLVIRKLEKMLDDRLDGTLTSIRNRKQWLIFVFGHDTLDDAFKMATQYIKVKETILEFLQEIDQNVKCISLRCWVREQNGSSEQDNKNADKSSIKSESILFSAPGESEEYESKTDWFCKFEKDEFEIDQTSSHKTFTRLKKMFDNMYRCTLKRVLRGSLILECGHKSQGDALEMMKNHVKVKDTIQECLQEMDSRVSVIKVEVEYRETEDPHIERDPPQLFEPGHQATGYVNKEEHDQIVEALKQHVSSLTKQQAETLEKLNELEQAQMADTRMMMWMKSGAPQPSESSGVFTATEKMTDVSEEQFQDTEDLSEAGGGYEDEEGVSKPRQKSESVIHLKRQLADLKQELKATTDRMQRLETTHKKASSHPSEMDALRHGGTQESDLDVYSREEETRKSGTPLGRSSDTPATPTLARRDPEADRDLLKASREGNMAAVKRILAAGRADVNCRDESRRTPVMRAAWRRHKDVVKLLVSGGADVLLVDEGGDNILHYACIGGDVKTVKCVLSLHVADINSRGEGSRTPVMRAAWEGHRDVVELLVSKGADVSLVNKAGNNILHLACWGGDLETVKFVLSLHVVDINSSGMGSRTPVMWAADRGHRDMVELLVSKGADVSLVNKAGNNILHLACRGGDVGTVKFVLSLHVADINSRGVGSRTPVMEAAVGGHRDVVELLVSEGADVSLVDEVGNNILHYACVGGDEGTVKFVLSLHVVDIDARNNDGETTADRARLGGHKKVVKLLQPPCCHVM